VTSAPAQQATDEANAGATPAHEQRQTVRHPTGQQIPPAPTLRTTQDFQRMARPSTPSPIVRGGAPAYTPPGHSVPPVVPQHPGAMRGTPHATQASGNLYQVLAFVPSGLNPVQSETNRPIGIYRQDRRRHETPMNPGMAEGGSTEVRRHVCQECNVAFIRPSELRVRELSQEKRPTHVCVYQAHMHRHGGRKQYACNLCDGEFSTASNLSRHNRTQHGIGLGSASKEHDRSPASSPGGSPATHQRQLGH
jgi:hypothetical protein